LSATGTLTWLSNAAAAGADVSLSCPAVCAVCADKAMEDVFGALYVSLHVRVSNKGAIHLYTETLGYRWV
jgi:peptide alpha-N-acetyltransferase